MQKETNDLAKKLQSAIVAGDAKAVRRLIKGGVDVNSQTIPLNTWVRSVTAHILIILLHFLSGPTVLSNRLGITSDRTIIVRSDYNSSI